MNTPIRVLERSFKILKFILLKGEVSVTDISRELGLAKSTVHRILNSLKQLGFVSQHAFLKKYGPGPEFAKITSNTLVSHKMFVMCADKEIKTLRDITDETVVLHIRNGLTRICIAEYRSRQNLKYTVGVGTNFPIYTGASGKVLMASLEGNELRHILEIVDMQPLTDKTIVNKEDFIKEIEKVRKQGYATSFGERAKGSSCISVSVKDYAVPVALSVLGPESRMNLEKACEMLPVMQKIAELISSNYKNYVSKMQA